MLTTFSAGRRLIVTRLPIITYHSLDESGSAISISPSMFRRQIGWLAAHRYETLKLSDALSCLRAGRLPERSIALTFDDGFLNTLTVALPALSKHGFTATMFAVHDYLGRTNSWPGQPRSLPRLALMDWSGVKELQAARWEIGAHTRTHPDLTRQPMSQASVEIAGCRELLEQGLGCQVSAFAYPYGRYVHRVRALVEEVYSAAVTTRLGLAWPDQDRFTLNRIDAYYLTRPSLVRHLEHPLLPAYLAARQAIRDSRGVS